MKCPHCLDNIHVELKQHFLGQDADGFWAAKTYRCPSCEKIVVTFGWSDPSESSPLGYYNIQDERLVRPKCSTRPPCPLTVPSAIADDYNEACIVLPDSPKASAALSRRSLQNLLREKAGVNPGNLANEIQEVIDNGNLPSHLAESIDAIRNIGNFSAHPNKSKNTGEIIPVEAHEAEWTLDVLESLFDFYFVQPEKLRLKREALNNKLAEMGKPPMK
jgi:hypothetical protein